MLRLFDYIYYRIYQVYSSQQSDVNDSYTSALVSLLQFMTLVSIFFLLTLFIELKIPSTWVLAPFIIIFMIFNWYRYERNFDIEELSSQWSDEVPSEKKKKGWLIVLWFGVVILIPVSIGVLRHNLELI